MCSLKTYSYYLGFPPFVVDMSPVRQTEELREWGDSSCHMFLEAVVCSLFSMVSSGYEQVSVSSGVGRTGCWHEYKSPRKRGINFILKPIDKLDHRCAGKMFNFNFVCIALVQNS